MKGKLTVEQRAEVVKLGLEGQKQESIAARFGVTPQAISQILLKAGIRRKGGKAPAARPGAECQ